MMSDDNYVPSPNEFIAGHVERWPDYAEYQQSTDRDIPVVICEPR